MRVEQVVLREIGVQLRRDSTFKGFGEE